MRSVFPELLDYSYSSFLRECHRLGLTKKLDSVLFSEKVRALNQFKIQVHVPVTLSLFWKFPVVGFIDEKSYSSDDHIPHIIVNKNNPKFCYRKREVFKVKCIACTFTTGHYVYKLFRGKNDTVFFLNFMRELKK